VDIELKTSSEWEEECKVIVLDPDGWDRENYHFSWFEEKITKEEFERRLMFSTCRFAAFKDMKSIWKEE